MKLLSELLKLLYRINRNIVECKYAKIAEQNQQLFEN